MANNVYGFTTTFDDIHDDFRNNNFEELNGNNAGNRHLKKANTGPVAPPAPVPAPSQSKTVNNLYAYQNPKEESQDKRQMQTDEENSVVSSLKSQNPNKPNKNPLPAVLEEYKMQPINL